MRDKGYINGLTLLLVLLAVPVTSYPQQPALDRIINNVSFSDASISISVIDNRNGETILEHQGNSNLIPASVLKLATTSAAIEQLGAKHTFLTSLFYTGSIDTLNKTLNGDIVIVGGGDPSFGSERFKNHYGDIFNRWTDSIRNLGINYINGRIIADDSYYDYDPVPGKWLWEDIGNYYGSGVYGLMAFDNTFRIHFRTGKEETVPILTGITPEEYVPELNNKLIVRGDTDQGYIFLAPYSEYGWISGTIPANRMDFKLKGAISDPPLLVASILSSTIGRAGIKISGDPTTTRVSGRIPNIDMILLDKIISPTLGEICRVLNHESVNLYAETLVKELDKNRGGSGSLAGGLEIINTFMEKTTGESRLILTDGSGLSQSNRISSNSIVGILTYMYNSNNCDPFLNSLSAPGEEGTIKGVFKDPVFSGRLIAKSGSMEGVCGYAGYLTAETGRSLSFCVIVNNFTGHSSVIVPLIEDLLKNIIIEN